MAVFLGENLFNEKELQGRDGLVPRSGLPDAQFLMDCRIFIWVSNSCLKCLNLFVSEAFKLSANTNSGFGISAYFYSYFYLSSILIFHTRAELIVLSA